MLEFQPKNKVLDLKIKLTHFYNMQIRMDLKQIKYIKILHLGLSFDRGEFQTLLMDVIQYKVKAVFITNKDRFSRISFNMWKELFAYFNCRIVVLNETEDKTENEEKEIFEDIISMIHCFAMKMYSKRRKNKLKLIEENLEIEKQYENNISPDNSNNQ